MPRKPLPSNVQRVEFSNGISRPLPVGEKSRHKRQEFFRWVAQACRYDRRHRSIFGK